MIPLWKYPFCSVIRIKIFGANCEILFALGLDWKWTEDIASSRQSRVELSNWAWSHRLKITVYCTLYNCGIVTGWKLPGNSFKWERDGPATTQAGARISHYRQNQNNPHLRTQHLGIQPLRKPFGEVLTNVTPKQYEVCWVFYMYVRFVWILSFRDQ